MLAEGERCPDCRARGPGFARVAALGAYRAAANAEWLLALKYGGRGDLAQPLGALLAARLALESTIDPAEHTRGALGAVDVAQGDLCAARSDLGAARADAATPRAVGHADRNAADRISDRAGATNTVAFRPRVLVPVPLHLARRIERGYDQAALLAESCAAEAGIPVIHALRRTRSTTVQGALGTVSRAANVRGAFAPSFAARWHARRLAGADAWLVDDVLTSGSTAAECARILRRLGARRVSVLCVARP